MSCPEELTPKAGSPGVVLDQEIIVRVLFDPDDWQDGAVNPGKLGIKRLRRSEFSVARSDHCNADTIRSQVIEKRGVGKNPQKYIGVIKAMCSDIRYSVGNFALTRLFCVHDDPLENFAGHALIGFSEQTRGGFWDKNDATAALLILGQKFEENGSPLRLEDCFR
jgi:hypothetical protein